MAINNKIKASGAAAVVAKKKKDEEKKTSGANTGSFWSSANDRKENHVETKTWNQGKKRDTSRQLGSGVHSAVQKIRNRTGNAGLTRLGTGNRQYSAPDTSTVKTPEYKGFNWEKTNKDTYINDASAKLLKTKWADLYDAVDNAPDTIGATGWIQLAALKNMGRSAVARDGSISSDDMEGTALKTGNGIGNAVMNTLFGDFRENGGTSEYHQWQTDSAATVKRYVQNFADKNTSEDEYIDAMDYIRGEIAAGEERNDTEYVSMMNSMYDDMLDIGVGKKYVSAIQEQYDRAVNASGTASEEKANYKGPNIDALYDKRAELQQQIDSGMLYDMDLINAQDQIAAIDEQINAAEKGYTTEADAYDAKAKRAASDAEYYGQLLNRETAYSDYMNGWDTEQNIQTAADYAAGIQDYNVFVEAKPGQARGGTYSATMDQIVNDPYGVLQALEDAQHPDNGRLRDDVSTNTDVTAAECALFMTQEERTRYFQLAAEDQKTGEHDAQNFFDLLRKRTLEQRRQDAISELVGQEYEEAGTVKKFGMNAATIPLKLLGQLITAGSAVSSMIDGTKYNAYGSANDLMNVTGTARELTREELYDIDQKMLNDESFPAGLRNVINFITNGQGVFTGLYDTATNVADNLFRGAMTGGLIGMGVPEKIFEFVNMGTMGLTSFAESCYSNYEKYENREWTYDEYMMHNIADGANEIIQETCFGQFEWNADVQDVHTLQDALKYIAKTGMDEGMEELLGAELDVVFDQVISRMNGNDTEIRQEINDYIRNGHYTEGEATVMALLENLICTPVASGGAGALSGIAMGGGSGFQKALHESAVAKHIGTNIARGGAGQVARTMKAGNSSASEMAQKYTKLMSKLMGEAGIDLEGIDDRTMEMYAEQAAAEQEQAAAAEVKGEQAPTATAEDTGAEQDIASPTAEVPTEAEPQMTVDEIDGRISELEAERNRINFGVEELSLKSGSHYEQRTLNDAEKARVQEINEEIRALQQQRSEAPTTAQTESEETPVTETDEAEEPASTYDSVREETDASEDVSPTARMIDETSAAYEAIDTELKAEEAELAEMEQAAKDSAPAAVEEADIGSYEQTDAEASTADDVQEYEQNYLDAKNTLDQLQQALSKIADIGSEAYRNLAEQVEQQKAKVEEELEYLRMAVEYYQEARQRAGKARSHAVETDRANRSEADRSRLEEERAAQREQKSRQAAIEEKRAKVEELRSKHKAARDNMMLAIEEGQRIRKERGAAEIERVSEERAAAEAEEKNEAEAPVAEAPVAEAVNEETEETKAEPEKDTITDEQRQAALKKMSDVEAKLEEFFKSGKNRKLLGRIYQTALEQLGAEVADVGKPEAEQKIRDALGTYDGTTSEEVIDAMSNLALGIATEEDMDTLYLDIRGDQVFGSTKMSTQLIMDMIRTQADGIFSGTFTRLGENSGYSQETQNRMKIYQDLFSAPYGPTIQTLTRKQGNEARGKREFTAMGKFGDVVVKPTGQFKTENGRLLAGVEHQTNGETTELEYVPIDSFVGINEGQAATLNTIKTIAGTNAQAAEALWSGYQASGMSDTEYGNALLMAYQYGRSGLTAEQAVKEMSPNAAANRAIRAAAENGRSSRKTRNEGQKTKAKGGSYRSTIDGNTYDLSDAKQREQFAREMKLSNTQAAAVEVFNNFVQGKSVNVELFRSKADADNIIRSENGRYEPSTNTIYIDINAGMDNTKQGFLSYAMARVFSHELTHFIQSNNSEGYNDLVSAVMNSLSKAGESFEAMVSRRMQTIQRDSKKTETQIMDEAIDEVVANACEMMLQNTTLAEDIASEVANRDMTLAEKILKFIRDFLADLKKAFAGLNANSREARILSAHISDMENVQNAWDRALKGAMELSKIQTIDDTAARNEGIAVSEMIAEEMESDRVEDPNKRESIRSTVEWRRSHMENYPNDFSFEQMSSLIEQFDQMVLMSDVLRSAVPHGIVNDVRTDRDASSVKGAKREGNGDNFGKSNIGPLRSNEEYGFTFDLDTKCERTYNYLYLRNNIQNTLGRQLTSFEARQLIELMRADGRYMIPCTYCYVEGKRMMLADGYMKTVKKEAKKMTGRKLTPSDVYNAVEATRTIVSGWMDDRFNRDENYRVDPKTAVKDKNGNTIFEGYRDFWMPAGVKVSDLVKEICEQYDIPMPEKQPQEVTKAMTKDQLARYKFQFGAQRVIENNINEWIYNHKLDVPMNLSDTTTDWKTAEIDWQALNMHSRGVIAAQGGVKANVVKNYKPYTDELSRVTDAERDHMNAMGGARIHSSNDFQVGNIQDYLLFFSDLAAGRSNGKGWYVHTYSKNLTFADIFSRFGARINCSVAFYTDRNGKIVANEHEGCNQEQLQKLRKRNSNIGAMAMVTDNSQLAYALNSDWVDMIIPFHASGMPAEMFYDVMGWQNYTSIQGERELNKDDMVRMIRSKIGEKTKVPGNAEAVRGMFRNVFDIVTGDAVPTTAAEADALMGEGKIVRLTKKNSKGNTVEYCPHFFPYDSTDSNGNFVPGHHNDAERYKALCELYGGKPRFQGLKIYDEAQGKEVDVTDHTNYVKLIKETARTDTEQQYISMDDITKPSDEEGKSAWDKITEAMESFSGYDGFNQDPGDLQHRFISDYVGENGDPIIGTAEDVRKGKAKYTVGEFNEIDQEKSDRNKGISDQYYEARQERVDQLHQDAYEAEQAGDEKEAKKIMDTHNLPANPVKSQTARRSARDTEYMNAVESGDMETAQRMVDEAAKAAGYDEVLYHGTRMQFNRFKRGYEGIHFGTFKAANDRSESGFIIERAIAEGDKSGKRIIRAFVRGDNHIEVPFDMITWNAGNIAELILYSSGYDFDSNKDYHGFNYILGKYEIENGMKKIVPGRNEVTGIPALSSETINSLLRIVDTDNWDEFAEVLNSIGVDCIKYINDAEDIGSWSYIITNPNQVKLADPVTYDDNGDVIPLSERFNEQSEDIRYSFRGYSPEGYEIYDSDGDFENVSMDDRIKMIEEKFNKEYIGKSIAYITKKGNVRLAMVDNLNKHRVKHSSNGENQWEKGFAKIAANGDYMDAIDGAYPKSVDRKPRESEKHKKGHAGVTDFDNIIKTVVVDGYYIDLHITTRNIDGERYVYEVNPKRHKKSASGSDLNRSSGNNQLSSSTKSNIHHKPGNGKLNSNSRRSARDTSYMNAVQAGDMETAQKMVDQAAIDAGYVSAKEFNGYSGKMYHGSNVTDITEFNTEGSRTKSSKYQLLFGTHLTLNPDFAEMYTHKAKGSKGTGRTSSNITGRVYELYAKLGNTLDLIGTVGEEGSEAWRIWESLPEKDRKWWNRKYNMPVMEGKRYVNGHAIEDVLDHMGPEAAQKWLKENGYNSVRYNATYIDNGRQVGDISYIVLDPSQLKSSDPVTYDDNGDVIPLSERFNTEYNDIRYSKRNGEVTDSDLLRMAGEAVAQTDTEREYMQMYQKNAHEMQSINRHINETYEAMDKAKKAGDDKEVTANRHRLDIYHGQLERAMEKAVKLEESKPLQGVMDRIRTETEAAVMDALQEVRNMDTASDGDIGEALQKQAHRYQLEIVTLKDRIKRAEAEAAKARSELKNGTDKSRRGKAPATKDLIDSYQKRIKQLETRIASMDNGSAKALAKEVQKRDNAIANLKDRRKASETRQKIRRIIDDFNKKLAHPRKGQYIPAEMVRGIIDALEQFDLSYVRGGEEIVSKKIREMHEVYERYKKDGEYTYHNAFISAKLEQLADTIGDTKFRNMKAEQLQLVYEVMKSLHKVVTEAVNFKALEGYQDAIEAGDEAIYQIKDAEPMVKGKAGEILNWMSSPDNFFKRISGFAKDAVLTKMQRVFVQGEQKMLEIQREYVNLFSDLTNTDAFKALNQHSEKDLVDVGLTSMEANENGEHEPVMITRGMMLALYMHLSCEDNIRGIARGGIKVPNLKRYYEKNPSASFDDMKAVRTAGVRTDTDANRIDISKLQGQEFNQAAIELTRSLQEAEDAEVARLTELRKHIYDMMTEDELKMISMAHEWYDDISRSELNDVSMDMYGFKVAAVENYFPIHRDPNFLATQFQSISNDASLANMGFLKERVKASQPILLTDFAYEIAGSVDSTSRYVGFARAERDFNLLYRAQLPGMSTSLREQIGKKFGSGDVKMGVTGMQYIENYVNNIIGNNRNKATIWDDIRSNLARSTLTLNPRVALSQAASIPTAVAELDLASVAAALKDVGIAFDRKAKDQLAQDDIWFWQRYRGQGGMTEFADAKKNGTKLDRIYNRINDTWFGQHFMNWCQDFDVGSTAIIHKATEYWVTKNTGYTQGTEAWKQAVADKYRDVLRRTQPMYMTTARSDLMRSNDAIMKTFTMFKTQASQNLNTLYNASAEFRKFKQDLANGLNGVTEADVREAKNRFQNSIAGVAMGAVAYAFFRFLVNAMMGKLKKYKDDETDEVTLMSSIKGMGLEALKSLSSMVVFGDAVWDAADSTINKTKYYGLNETAVGQISGLADSTIKMLQSVGTDKFSSNADYFMSDLAGVCGIPWDNMKNAVSAGSMYFNGLTTGMYESSLTRTDDTMYNRMISALLDGNMSTYESVMKEEMRSSGKSKKETQAGLKNRIGDWYESGALTREEATKLLTGDQLDLEADDVFWFLDKVDYKIGNGGKSEGYSVYSIMKDAIMSGSEASIEDALSFYKTHGYAGKTADVLKASAKSLYESDQIDWETARNILIAGGGFTDKKGKIKEDSLFWTQQEWDWNKSDSATARFTEYNKYIELDKAIDDIDINTAQDQIRFIMEHGITKSDVAKHLRSVFQETYLEMLDADPDSAEKYLTSVIIPVYKAAGYSEAEERAYIKKNWL